MGLFSRVYTWVILGVAFVLLAVSQAAAQVVQDPPAEPEDYGAIIDYGALTSSIRNEYVTVIAYVAGFLIVTTFTWKIIRWLRKG